MTIGQILSAEAKKLQKAHSVSSGRAKIKNPHLEAEILLSYVLKKPREWILAHLDKELNALQIKNYKRQIFQRKKNVPLAYITGHKEFYGLDFKVNKHTLVPRPETELMVDTAVNSELLAIDGKLLIIDVGTGSGNIIISAAKHIKNKRVKFYAVDISKSALKTAQDNAIFHKINNIKFLSGNLLSPVLNDLRRPGAALKESMIRDVRMIICANLPYLTSTQYKQSPSIQKEPRPALLGGPDGLKYYQQLFIQLSTVVSNFSSVVLLCEIAPRQKNKILTLGKKYLPAFEGKIKKDLRGHSRLAIFKS